MSPNERAESVRPATVVTDATFMIELSGGPTASATISLRNSLRLAPGLVIDVQRAVAAVCRVLICGETIFLGTRGSQPGGSTVCWWSSVFWDRWRCLAIMAR